ncbi:MAG: colicin D domain-containing protein [Alphaproteobacteria bacterium]
MLRPGGKTEGAINDALRENDRSERYYVWRTVRDDHVRPAHAAREGQVFRWGEDLFGGPPGEDFNCRCWAEPLYVGYKPPPIPKKPEVVAGQPQEENLYPDAIKSTMGPVEIIAGGVILRSGAFHIYRAIQVIETKRRRAIENLEHRKIEPRWEVNPPRNQLQKKYEHAEDFGINGNANNKTLEEFKKAIQRHADDPETQIIKGTYHKQKVTHYYNAKTKLNVIRGKSGDFKTGFKLDKRQIDHIEMYGSLGGGK